MRTKKLLLLLALPFLAILVVTALWLLRPANPLVTGQGFEGVIFTKENAADLLKAVVSSETSSEVYWTPERSDILDVEEQFVSYAQEQVPGLAPRLPEFKRQYFGFLRGGKRLILIIGFCRTNGKDWQREMMSMANQPDGCYYEAQYDFTDGIFLYLWQNSGR